MIGTIKKLAKYLRFYGGSYYCIVCNTPVRTYFKFSDSIERLAKSYNFQYDFKRVETLNYEKCNCPFCMSSDRERFYLIFLTKYFSGKHTVIKVLDFAPNHEFVKRVKKFLNVQYTSADYLRDDMDLKLDACNMNSINNESYDIVIFSHVLEHVEKPLDALTEIFRIVRRGGFAIIMVPLFLDVEKTHENPDHTSEALRWQHYGQGDHLRLYSKKDFINQIESVGFEIEEVSPSKFNPELIRQNAIAENSILYKCNKNDSQT